MASFGGRLRSGGGSMASSGPGLCRDFSNVADVSSQLKSVARGWRVDGHMGGRPSSWGGWVGVGAQVDLRRMRSGVGVAHVALRFVPGLPCSGHLARLLHRVGGITSADGGSSDEGEGSDEESTRNSRTSRIHSAASPTPRDCIRARSMHVRTSSRGPDRTPSVSPVPGRNRVARPCGHSGRGPQALSANASA